MSVYERDVCTCISHQSDWIYHKQPIKFFVFVARKSNKIFLFEGVSAKPFYVTILSVFLFSSKAPDILHAVFN